MTRFINRVFPVVVQVPAPTSNVAELKQFLKRHDPYFANDAYLNKLSLEELTDYYQDVVDALKPCYRDDWDDRLINVRANNL